MHAALRGDIHAVERQHHGQAEALHFEREAQADRQVHRVDHAHHEFGRRRVRDAAQQDVARDGFVERRRAQAVGARQIEDAQRASVGGGALAFAALDGDARVVSDLLAAAGQAIEERGLAAIGNADQRDAQRREWKRRRPSRTLGERGAGVLRRQLRSRRRLLRRGASPARPPLRRGAMRRSNHRRAPPADRPTGHMRAMTSQRAPATKPRSRRRASRMAPLPCPSSKPATSASPATSRSLAAAQLGERMSGSGQLESGDFTGRSMGLRHRGCKCDGFAFAE